MSKWAKVGNWLKENAGAGASLVGSLLTGNVPGAVAAGVALVSGATGTADPDKVLESFQRDPQTVIRLRELAMQEDASIRKHLRAIAELELKEYQEQQETIRAGDSAADEYVRHTRPKMARQSWYGTLGYVVVTELAEIAGYGTGASVEIALLLLAPAGAYLGFRSADKWFSGRFSKK